MGGAQRSTIAQAIRTPDSHLRRRRLATAWAGHDHYIVTPNGRCHQVAPGQTGISDPNAGGYHQFHDHVHLGATGGTSGAPYQLGDGHAQVVVYKDDCVAP